MRKKLATLLLSVLVLGVLAIPVNSLKLPTGHSTITPMGDAADPERSS